MPYLSGVYYAQFCKLQQQLLLACQFKIYGSDFVFVGAFHCHYFSKPEFLMFHLHAGLEFVR